MAAEVSWFWRRPEPLPVSEIARLAEADLVRDAPAGAPPIGRVAPLEAAGPGDLTFFDNPKYLEAVATARATACIVGPRYKDRVPEGCAVLVAREPGAAVARVLSSWYPTSLRPGSAWDHGGAVAPGAHVHPTARLEDGVTVDPGATIGAGAEIGMNTTIGAGASIGPGVRIGRKCAIGAGSSVQHALIGNRVILHPGVRIGQDGFGYIMGRAGHAKSPQIGRVIVQDDVEIGANTCIDRGAIRDTVIGEGTKIDNLVQIAHNVVIGRHCVIVAQVGIAGSATLEDFVVLGARAGVIGHVTVGEGAQIAASANVAGDVPAGARWGGTPAQPIRDWLREIAYVQKQSRLRDKGGPEKEDASP